MKMSVIKPHHFMEFIKNCKGFDKALQKVNIISMQNGQGLAELKIEEEHINPLGTLHGGLTATLVDVISSLGLTTHDAASGAHVSVDMHLSFYKSATIGDVIEVHSNTVKIGKKLAFLEILLKNKNTSELLAKGTHTKFLLGGGE